MDPEEALGALCLMSSFFLMLVTGKIILAIGAIALLYAYLKIVGA